MPFDRFARSRHDPLPQDVVEALGWPPDGKIIVTLANEEKIELPRARLLSLAFG